MSETKFPKDLLSQRSENGAVGCQMIKMSEMIPTHKLILRDYFSFLGQVFPGIGPGAYVDLNKYLLSE